MGFGERPPQGELFPEFIDNGFKEPLTKPVQKPAPCPMFEASLEA